jgi:hypothetical protein
VNVATLALDKSPSFQNWSGQKMHRVVKRSL